ncbi:hypothetical protein OHB24_27125 [Kribbella sp. NBC_00482]|uniref:hypothetical protein n=1 Tax=Kribbella sp. NBC_00482 TaxID=2975968 RepID=UPI002E17CCEC
MRIFASIIAAVLLLAGCGSNKPAGSAASAAPPTVTVTTTPPATPAPVTPSSVEQAEVNYQQAVCTAALQIYVSVQEKSDRPPAYSRAVSLGLDGCTELTEAEYEQAVVRWAKLGN